MAVVTTNLLLNFPLIKLWTKQLFENRFGSSTKGHTHKASRGFRTIGGGSGTGSNYLGYKKHKALGKTGDDTSFSIVGSQE